MVNKPPSIELVDKEEEKYMDQMEFIYSILEKTPFYKNMKEEAEERDEMIFDLLSEIWDGQEGLIKSINELKELKKLEFSKMNIELLGKKYQVEVWFEKDNEMYVSFAPSLEIASQGETIIDAYVNLKDAIELYFEKEDDDFIKDKLKALK